MQEHHKWLRLFKDPKASWDDIVKTIKDVIKNGAEELHDSHPNNYIISHTVNGHVVQVIVRKAGGSIVSIVNAWVGLDR